MTQAQEAAYECGVVPGEHDARFVKQHLAAYAFARPLVQDKRYLEIGFGEGYGLYYLSEVTKDATGIDLAPGNIPRAQAKYQRPYLRFVHMPGTELQFPDASFDVAGSFQVIEHIPEPQLIAHLTEVRRVLTTNGLYCLSTLNLEHNMKPGRSYQKLEFHEKEFTAPELRSLLEEVFPQVELYGLYLTKTHQAYQRLKRWGLNKWGPAHLNPVAQYFEHMTEHDFRARRSVSKQALDLIAICRKTPRQEA